MQKNFWNSAAMDGLLLALVCIIMTLAKSAITLGSGLAIVLQIGQVVATIWMLLYFMKRYGASQEQYPYGGAFNYGFTVSLCSNIIILAYLLLHYNILFPDAVTDAVVAMESFMEGFASGYGTDMSLVDTMMKYYHLIAPISAFLMYTIWAAIISAILASFAKKETPMFPTEEEA